MLMDVVDFQDGGRFSGLFTRFGWIWYGKSMGMRKSMLKQSNRSIRV